MDNLIKLILKTVQFQRDSEGKIKYQKSYSSYKLPVIDEKKTKEKASLLMKSLLTENSPQEVIEKLKKSIARIKFLYMISHDGFRRAKGIGRDEKTSVHDIYSFSVVAGYCLELLPRNKKIPHTKICTGVMAPAVQDSGINLIKSIWEISGYEVIDLGNTVKPEAWIKALEDHELALISVSCMTNKCLKNLDTLSGILSERKQKMPLIIGGVAVNKVIAYELSQKYKIQVFFVQGITDAENVLAKALSEEPRKVPKVKKPSKFELPPDISLITDMNKIRLFKLRISDIVMVENSRERPSKCSMSLKNNCSPNSGYEKQKSFDANIKFLNDFKFAVLALMDFPDESDSKTCKTIWYDFIQLEQYFDSVHNAAYAFRLTMACPFCLPKDCRLSKGYCQYPAYYRPGHETYKIHMIETLKNVFGDDISKGIGSIILVK